MSTLIFFALTWPLCIYKYKSRKFSSLSTTFWQKPEVLAAVLQEVNKYWTMVTYWKIRNTTNITHQRYLVGARQQKVENLDKVSGFKTSVSALKKEIRTFFSPRFAFIPPI